MNINSLSSLYAQTHNSSYVFHQGCKVGASDMLGMINISVLFMRGKAQSLGSTLRTFIFFAVSVSSSFVQPRHLVYTGFILQTKKTCFKALSLSLFASTYNLESMIVCLMRCRQLLMCCLHCTLLSVDKV